MGIRPSDRGRGSPHLTTQTLHRRLNILVMTEQVRRIVFVLQSHEPLVIRPSGGLDALRPLVGLKADLIDVVAAGREGADYLRQLAHPPMFTSSAAGPANSTRSATRTARRDD